MHSPKRVHMAFWGIDLAVATQASMQATSVSSAPVFVRSVGRRTSCSSWPKPCTGHSLK